MKKDLQNNFTTPEQSKRLLALGVPADSADLMYDISEIERETYDFPTFVYGRFSRYTDGLYVPCWSVGRLIEILEITFGTPWSDHQELCKSTLLERVVRDFEDIVKYKEIFNDNRIDFSQLDEL